MMTMLKEIELADLGLVDRDNFREVTYPGVKLGLYLVNPFGEVYSNYKKSLMNPSKDKDGYLRLVLSGGSRDKKVYIRIANLTAYTFIGPPSEKLKDPTINHIDGDVLNNCVSNLEWIERSKNSAIRKNKGAGNTNHEAKLSWEQVREIRERYKNEKISYDKLKDEYNVSKTCIAEIIRGESWKE